LSAPDLSLVIVSFNTRDLLAACLAALPAAASGLAWETIVVDNGSRDGTVDMVREHFPKTILIAAGENLGFARAMNLGLAGARGRIVCWLNPDCVASPASLAGLVEHLDAHAGVGAAGPRLVFPDGRVQPSAQAFPGVVRVLYHFLGLRVLAGAGWLSPLLRRVARRAGPMTRSYIESLAPGLEPRSVDWLSGACLAARAGDAAAVGPLDEGYFMYCEDTDWCHRLRSRRLEVHYLPAFVVVHHVGASRPFNPEVVYHYYRSLLRYFLKHRPAQSGLVRGLMLAGFCLHGVCREAGRLLGRRAPHPWWRLVRLCWSPATLVDGAR
jgi:N-acetylglucosaminyl-diphospho-decaprenol L-rhamnosyltransferase